MQNICMKECKDLGVQIKIIKHHMATADNHAGKDVGMYKRMCCGRNLFVKKQNKKTKQVSI